MEKNLDREFLKLIYRGQPRKPEELRRQIPDIATYLGITEKELIDFLVKLHQEVLTEPKPPLPRPKYYQEEEQ